MLASDADIRSYKWLQDVLANVISKPFVNVISKPFVNIPSARARPVLLMYLWRVINVHVMCINVYMVKENLLKKNMFIVKVPCYKHSHFSPCESRVSESVIWLKFPYVSINKRFASCRALLGAISCETRIPSRRGQLMDPGSRASLRLQICFASPKK